MFYQDESGQWWKKFKSGTRTRCEVRTCYVCGKEFVCVPATKTHHCSKACGNTIHGTEQMKLLVKDRYLQGETITQLASSLRISNQVVSKWLAELNVPTRSQFSYGTDVTEKIQELFLAGEDIRAIGCTLDIAFNRVKSILRNLGLIDVTVKHRSEKPKKKPYVTVTIYEDDPYFCMVKRKKTSNAGAIHLHRLVMARYLGRPLLDTETVHHKDGNRQNNDISNLELWERRHGAGQRTRDLVLEDLKRLTPQDREYVLAYFS